MRILRGLATRLLVVVTLGVELFGCGGGGSSSGGTSAVSIPTAPVGVFSDSGDGKNLIAWNAVPGTTSYNIYWSNSAGVNKTNGTKIAAATNPYVHIGISNGSKYYYVVTAVNQAGESAVSAEVSSMPHSSISPPPAPGNVHVTEGDQQNVISWDPVDGAATYNIYWRNSAGVTRDNGTKITNAAAPYTHSGLASGSAYYYVVTAVNDAGESYISTEVSITPSGLATVYAIVTNPAVAALDSDVAAWIDATTGAKAPIPCAANTLARVPSADSLSYSITSTSYSTSGSIPASTLLITKVTLTLTPANLVTPQLPTMFANQPNLSAGATISPGATQTIPVRVVSQQLKEFMRDTTQMGALALTCSNNPIYSYLAVVSFEALEVNTNRVATITAAPMVINVSDFVDP